MTIALTEEVMTALPEYARVPIIFTVDRVLDVTSRDDGRGGSALSERRLDVPYVKDYDAIAGEGPLQWGRSFDLSKWALFTARFANRIVGGATLAFDTPGLTMLEGRRDLAVLWDIRVAADVRRQGVGSALFQRSRPGRSCTVVGSSRSKLRIPTCGHADSMSGRDDDCRRSIVPRILSFPRRSNYSGTRTYCVD